jgi:hypothetical protein
MQALYKSKAQPPLATFLAKAGLGLVLVEL